MHLAQAWAFPVLVLLAAHPACRCTHAISLEVGRPELSPGARAPAAALEPLKAPEAPAGRGDAGAEAAAAAGAEVLSAGLHEAARAILLDTGGKTSRSVAGEAAGAGPALGGRANATTPDVVAASGGNSMAAMGVWICVAAVVAVMVFSAYVLMWYAHITGGELKATDKEAISQRSVGRRAPAITRPRSSRASGVGKPPSSWSSFYTESPRYEESMRSSNVGAPTSQSATGESRRSTNPPLLPLCPQLIVPDGTRLKCILQEAVCRRKQDLTFNISGIAAHGGAPLFQVRVVERSLAAGACGIFVETLGGKEQFAFLSTQELWADETEAAPKFNIMRPGGLPYATMQKNPQGEYVVRGTQDAMMTFSGDFPTHDIQIRGALGQTVGLVGNSSGGEYEVQVNPRSDAGLVVLGLLAIDKCERTSTSPPGSSVGRGKAAPPTSSTGL